MATDSFSPRGPLGPNIDVRRPPTESAYHAIAGAGQGLAAVGELVFGVMQKNKTAKLDNLIQRDIHNMTTSADTGSDNQNALLTGQPGDPDPNVLTPIEERVQRFVQAGSNNGQSREMRTRLSSYVQEMKALNPLFSEEIDAIVLKHTGGNPTADLLRSQLAEQDQLDAFNRSIIEDGITFAGTYGSIQYNTDGTINEAETLLESMAIRQELAITTAKANETVDDKATPMLNLYQGIVHSHAILGMLQEMEAMAVANPFMSVADQSFVYRTLKNRITTQLNIDMANLGYDVSTQEAVHDAMENVWAPWDGIFGTELTNVEIVKQSVEMLEARIGIQYADQMPNLYFFAKNGMSEVFALAVDVALNAGSPEQISLMKTLIDELRGYNPSSASPGGQQPTLGPGTPEPGTGAQTQRTPPGTPSLNVPAGYQLPVVLPVTPYDNVRDTAAVIGGQQTIDDLQTPQRQAPVIAAATATANYIANKGSEANPAEVTVWGNSFRAQIDGGLASHDPGDALRAVEQISNARTSNMWDTYVQAHPEQARVIAKEALALGQTTYQKYIAEMGSVQAGLFSDFNTGAHIFTVNGKEYRAAPVYNREMGRFEDVVTHADSGAPVTQREHRLVSTKKAFNLLGNNKSVVDVVEGLNSTIDLVAMMAPHGSAEISGMNRTEIANWMVDNGGFNVETKQHTPQRLSMPTPSVPVGDEVASNEDTLPAMPTEFRALNLQPPPGREPPPPRVLRLVELATADGQTQNLTRMGDGSYKPVNMTIVNNMLRENGGLTLADMMKAIIIVGEQSNPGPSHTDDLGWTQINKGVVPELERRLGRELDRADPADAVEMGVNLLAEAVIKSNGSIEDAISIYNTGHPNWGEKAGGKVPGPSILGKDFETHVRYVMRTLLALGQKPSAHLVKLFNQATGETEANNVVEGFIDVLEDG